eukprot:jgi/Tetstr1/459546/TSEL_004911.t1
MTPHLSSSSDLRHLNSYCAVYSVRFETLRRLRYLAKRGDWAFSFDLQDGFYALGLREDVRDFFTINVRGTLWRFAALPMGWSLSPYYFCTLIAVMVRYLRQPDFATYSNYGRPFRRRLRRRKARGVCLLPFIDDFLFLAPSRQLALRLRAEVERVWGRLGLAKHPTKAHPEPTQQLPHLGLDLDLVTMQFRAPSAKLRRLSNLARDLMCIAAHLSKTTSTLTHGGASAASATGVPMPTIRWLGGWKVGSGVVLNYIVPGILNSTGARYFFGSLAPQRSAANISQ